MKGPRGQLGAAEPGPARPGGRGLGAREGGAFSPHGRAWVAALTLAALTGLAAMVTIASQATIERAAFDQDRFHLRVVEAFSEQWPRFDFSDYASATTPGYHLLLAAVHRFGGSEPDLLRLAGAAWAVVLAGVLAWACAARAGSARWGLVLALPACASPYVFASGTHLLPDNAGWALVLAVMLAAAAMTRPAPERARGGGGGGGGRDAGVMRDLVARGTFAGLLLVALVWFRQVHVWAAGMIWLAAMLGGWRAGAGAVRGDANGAAGGSGVRGGGGAPGTVRARWRGAALGAAAGVMVTGPALLSVAYFVRLWGGPVPPQFQVVNAAGADPGATAVVGMNPAVPGFVLAVVGAWGVFFAGALWPTLWAAPRRTLRAAGLGACVGALLSAAAPSSYSLSAGRFSGLWNLVLHTPVVAERSPVMIALSAAGGAVLGAFWVALGRAEGRGRGRGVGAGASVKLERWVWAAGLLGFVAAHTAGTLAWQRYVEPLGLVLLALMSASVAGAGGAEVGARGGADKASGREADGARAGDGGVVVSAEAARADVDEARACLPWWAAAGPLLLGAGLGALAVWQLRWPAGV